MKYIYLYNNIYIPVFFSLVKDYVQKISRPPTSEDCLPDQNILHNTRKDKHKKAKSCVLQASKNLLSGSV